MHNVRVVIGFYLRQKEEYGPGDSNLAPRNCSKEAGVSIYVILVKGENLQSSTYFFAKGFCSHEERSSACRILMRRYKNWAHKISP